MDNLGHTSPVGGEVPNSAAPAPKTPDFVASAPETSNFAPYAPEAPNFATQNPPENPPIDTGTARNRGINIIDSVLPPEVTATPVAGAEAMERVITSAPVPEQMPTLEQPPVPEQVHTSERPSTPEQSRTRPQPYITSVNSAPAQPNPNPVTPPTPNNTEITNTANYLGREAAKSKTNFGETAKATLLEGIEKDPLTFYSNYQRIRNNVPLGNKNVQNPTLYGGNS